MHMPGCRLELIPCIQTLAHLGTFLRWSANGEFRDQDTILMIDSEETYKLIDAMLRSLRSCFRTDKIHIGMDEAHGVGLGRYLQEHGMVDRFELLTRHLARVSEICKKYDFHPMMWSDMFFRLGSKNNEYYDMNAHIPQSVIDSLPDVDMVYWDYYMISDCIRRHAQRACRMAQHHFCRRYLDLVRFVPDTKRPGTPCCPACAPATRKESIWSSPRNGAMTAAETSHCARQVHAAPCSLKSAGRDRMPRGGNAKAAMCLTSSPRLSQRCAAFYPEALPWAAARDLSGVIPCFP